MIAAPLVGVDRAVADPTWLAFAAAFAAAAGLWVWITIAARLLGRLRHRA